jgi:phosphate transport system substrate-binding protein
MSFVNYLYMIFMEVYMNKRIIFVIAMFFTSAALFSIEPGGQLTGSGATFPEPLYKKMFDEYNKKTQVKVNYQGIGSGGGIKQLTEKVTDFGGTDAFMTDGEIKTAGASIVHIPTCIGAVVVVYNLPGLMTELKMTPEFVSGVFLGKITNWNDQQLKAINPGVKIPDLKISVVHRSDGSGTSFVFTDYLSKVSKEWSTKVGADKSPAWPAGIGGKGNPGVADLVSKIPGSVGYVELVYAIQNKISFAALKNKAGTFVVPSLASASVAADMTLPDDTRVSITDTNAKAGYPVASFTWLIVYKEQNYNNRSIAKAGDIINMLSWLIHDGQAYPEQLKFAPLPKAAVEKADKLIRTITYDGKSIPR